MTLENDRRVFAKTADRDKLEPTMPEPLPTDDPSGAERTQQLERLHDALHSTIIGQDQVVREVVWALLAGGHVLLEGAPGLGKTLLIKTLSHCLHLQFSRIQFTPDLMPSDITGNDVLLLDERGNSTGQFRLHPGPLFAQLVLADEINRASPKTQSALLEAMQEGAVTIAGKRHELRPPFMVFATENPIEMEGTYPLPEAQLDRFLFKTLVPSPDLAELETILELTTGAPLQNPPAVLSAEELLSLQADCRRVVVPRAIIAYAARLTAATTPESASAPEQVKRCVRFGAGVRGGQALILGAKARALTEGRLNTSFEDIRAVVKPALRHRLLLGFEGIADGITTDSILDEVLSQVRELPPQLARYA
jgi:MoxR-like ATPase